MPESPDPNLDPNLNPNLEAGRTVIPDPPPNPGSDPNPIAGLYPAPNQPDESRPNMGVSDTYYPQGSDPNSILNQEADRNPTKPNLRDYNPQIGDKPNFVPDPDLVERDPLSALRGMRGYAGERREWEGQEGPRAGLPELSAVLPKGTATVTAKYGPGLQATADVIENITAFEVQIARSVLVINAGADTPRAEYDLVGVTTFTVVVAGVNYTLTIS